VDAAACLRRIAARRLADATSIGFATVRRPA
jgi:hypothetical protein